MSQIIKPVALDETVVALNTTTLATNGKLEDIKTQIATLANMPEQIRSVLNSYAQTMGGKMDSVVTAVNQVPTNINTVLTDYANTMGGKMDTVVTEVGKIPTNIQTVLNAYAQTMGSKFDDLASDINTVLDGFADDLSRIITALKDVQAEYLPKINTAIGTTLTNKLGDQTNTLNTVIGTTLKNALQGTITDLGDALVGVLASVKSVNGETGDVVLDGNKLLMNRSQSGSKTVTQMITEMQTAISKTPLSFSASKISGTEDEYLMVVTQGTPS